MADIMSRSIASVATGEATYATWSSGEGWTATAEMGARGVVLRTINPDGMCVCASVLSHRDVRYYLRRAQCK